MLASLLLSCASRQAFDPAAVDAMAKARDVAGLTKLLDGPAPLEVLKTGGAYETGRFGWRAVAGEGYLVLTTPLTSEDIGDLLFKVTEGGKLRYIPESDAGGVRLVRHVIEAKFEPEKKRAEFTDEVEVAGNPGGRPLILRFSPAYRVSKASHAGSSVAFKQLGGVVIIPSSPIGKVKLEYAATVDLLGYAGSIGKEYIQLTNDYWYPMVGRLPSTYTLAATIPKDWTAVGQGERTTEPGGRVLFRMDLPTIYWSFSAEAFKTVSDVKDGRTISVWSRKLSPEQMKMQTELFRPILKFYEAFAPYPFSGFGAADVATYGSGALEAYSFATYGAGFLPSEDAHEPAHTWWGGIMNNTYLRSFWNESFAVFSDGLYNREGPVGDRLARRAAFADLALADPAYDRLAVRNGGAFAGPVASSLGYGKGAHVLAMLEQLVGTDRMIVGMREWIKGHPKGEPAEWEGFEATMLRLYPQFELGSFFGYWLDKPGVATVMPRLVEWKDGKVRGSFGPGVPRMPLEFVIVGKEGRFERRTLDTRSLDAGGAFALDSSFGKPTQVLFDPYHRALRAGAPAAGTGFFDVVEGWAVLRDPKHPGYLKIPGRVLTQAPADLANTVVVGHPDTLPLMKPLLQKVGMTVEGDTLSWNGTRVDLREAGAVAIVDLEAGKRCAVVLGTSGLTPRVGRASLALFDSLGRMLTGKTPLPTPRDGVFSIP